VFIVAQREDIFESLLLFQPENTGGWSQHWPLPWSLSTSKEDKRNDKARLKALGNAVLPPVAAVVGRALGRALRSEQTVPFGKKKHLLSPATKLPRAGFVLPGCDHVVELQPAAPRNRAEARELLPTPTSSRYGSSGNGTKGSLASGKKASLETLVREGRVPTPQASEAHKGGGYRGEWRSLGQIVRDERREGVLAPSFEQQVRERRSQEIEQRLRSRSLPTPTASAWKGGGQGGDWQRNLHQGMGGALSPCFVEWLMGFPLGWSDR